MPNARDAHALAQHRILLLGDTGSGKTSQILTLPGRKFVYCFDSNALLSLRGYDVDYEEHLPTPVSAAVASLSKSGTKDARGTTSSDVYMQFEREFDERLKSGWFDQYDWLCFDSITTLADLVMDRVLTINNRFGQWPNQDDYGPQMNALTNVVRTAIGIGKGVLFTGHLEVKQDDRTKQVTNRPMLTGRLVAKLPLLFSDIFYTDADVDKDGKPLYKIQTRPSGINKTIRTSIKGLEAFEDVTIDFTQPPEGQGLGGLLNWEARQLESAR